MDGKKRILIVDDDSGVRESYSSILSSGLQEDVLSRGAALFGDGERVPKTVGRNEWDLTFCDRGEAGVGAVELAAGYGRPFVVAFVDMKMPGIDGAETSKRIWAIDPRIKIVIVTAFSTFSPDDVVEITGRDDIFYLRKPFNPEEIRQFARALSNTWDLERERDRLTEQLVEAIVEGAMLKDTNRNLKEVREQTALRVQSEKMSSIGVLAAGMAHEIDNPITFVNTNLSTLKKYCVRIRDILSVCREMEKCMEEGMTDNIPPLLEKIKAAKGDYNIDFIMEDMVDLMDESLEGTGRVSNIVKDMRIFSRVDEAQMKYADINGALDATINIIGNELKYKAEIVKDYGDLPEVKCFVQKISQVFMNILMNAVQAIEESGTIEISTRTVQPGGGAEDGCVEIRIRDTGKGIPEKNRLEIFDPFFTTKPVGEGTGLGLSISYEIVDAHGGEIRAESEEGLGTVFIVSLPLEPAQGRGR